MFWFAVLVIAHFHDVYDHIFPCKPISVSIVDIKSSGEGWPKLIMGCLG